MPIIRNLTVQDWNQFQILELDTFKNDPLEKESFLANTEYDGFFGLFKDDDILIGYLYCRIYGDYAHLHRIGISSTERGKGYGSLLFEKAISYFEEHHSPKFSLFVETKNTPAIGLYEKYGLEKIFESWHFIIDLEENKKFITQTIANITSRELHSDDLVSVQNTFPQANLDEVKGMLEDMKKHQTSNHFIVMFESDEMKALARFNKKFSGCRPFFIKDIGYFDTFLDILIQSKEPEKDYVRITFDDNDELAKLCIDRNYKIHHHLYKMTRFQNK